MNKENPKKNKKSFEYYIAQRKEEFRCQYDHERSWENLQYKLQKRKNHRLSLYCVAASAAFLFLILGVSHIFSLHNNTQNKEAVVAAVVSFPETGSRKAILTLENGEKVDLSVKKGTISNAKLLQKSEMRKNMVMDLIYRGFINAANYSESHYNPRRSQIKTELRYLFVTTPNR